MTSWQVNEDQALADALGEVVSLLERQHDPVAAYVAEMRSSAAPGNGFHVASLPFGERGKVAAALRTVAEGHPLAGQLEGIASGLDASLAQHRVNGGRA